MRKAGVAASRQPHPEQPDQVDRQHTRWLRLARVVCTVVAVLALILFGVTLPTYFAFLSTPCLPNACIFQQLTASGAQSLHALGLSLAAYAAVAVMLIILTVIACVVVAAVLLWRAPDNKTALLVALMLVLLGTSSSTTGASILRPSLGPLLAGPIANLSNYFGALALPLIFTLFPNGRFVPRWTRWLALAMLIIGLVFTSGPPPSAEVHLLSTLFWTGCMLVLVGAQFYRYRRVSTPIERQQTKWVILGFALALLGLLGIILSEVLLPALQQPDSPYAIISPLVATFFLTVPIALSLGLGILRYRLWDIDAIIHKALVYGLLTGLLAAVYAGLIIGLEALAGLVSGQTAQQPAFIVVSTLAIAALFQPLRRRIQTLIDRRFYRRKYDAARTLAAFSATLRNEVDLNQLREHLLAVVTETMQPAQVSLWLRRPAQRTDETSQYREEQK